jgi:hypothetical protein
MEDGTFRTGLSEASCTDPGEKKPRAGEGAGLGL